MEGPLLFLVLLVRNILYVMLSPSAVSNIYIFKICQTQQLRFHQSSLQKILNNTEWWTERNFSRVASKCTWQWQDKQVSSKLISTCDISGMCGSEGLQWPRQKSELMGSKPFGEIENHLFLVKFIVKYKFLMNFLKNWWVREPFSQNWWAGLNPSNSCWRGTCNAEC